MRRGAGQNRDEKPLAKTHGQFDGGQECYLLKIEGAYDKNYWLFVDVPLDKPLSGVDSFLREIWLECCGHLSKFSGYGHGYGEVGKGRKLQVFSIGDTLLHEYDFGTTTETIITIAGQTTRKKQRETARLLARNVPPTFECAACGKPAAYICTECVYDSDNPFYCEECGEKHDHDDMLLPVTNSPRMGECGYDGELDVFALDSAKLAGK